MNDWQDEVAAEIIAASVREYPKEIHPLVKQSLSQYQQDPVKVEQAQRRSVERCEVYELRAQGAMACGLLTAIAALGLQYMIYGNHPGITVFGIISFIGLVAAIGGIGFFFWNEGRVDYPGLDIIHREKNRYLPSIQYTKSRTGVEITLADQNKIYAAATFLPDEETAALEYQVELESIVEAVRQAKTNQFIHSCIGTRAAVPQLAITPAVNELQETLESQRLKIHASA